MAKKASKAKIPFVPPFVADPPTSPRLKSLQKLFEKGHPSEYKVVMEVDVIIARGTPAEAMDAFALIPPARYYVLPRMLLLRRLWQLGEDFIRNPEYRERFDYLRLLNAEYKKMVAKFGAQATIEFFTPSVLRKQAA